MEPLTGSCGAAVRDIGLEQRAIVSFSVQMLGHFWMQQAL